MCGIAGILSSQLGKTSDPMLGKMSDTLAHRGPDGSGMIDLPGTSGYVGLAHRRLAVIDLSDSSRQPLHYLERYVIVHNGEIYNFREIREQLKKKGLAFSSQGDTEVIAAAYHQYGEACTSYFDGMFAFAIWDKQKEVLFCARDRFGEKPLYYWYDRMEDRWLFASEMKALRAAGAPGKVDAGMLLAYLGTGQVQAPLHPERTFFEEIFQLPPAHQLSIRLNPIRWDIRNYWDLDKESVAEISDQEATERFYSLLHASLALRLRSDRPVGSSISGGIDSSAIAASCRNTSSSTYTHHAFSAVFPGFDRDERLYMDEIHRQESLIPHFVQPDAAGLVRDIDRMMYQQEEPLSSASPYNQYCIAEAAAAQGITVLLDGQGADEILGGYPRHMPWYLQEHARTKGIRSALREAAGLKQNEFLKTRVSAALLAACFPGLTASWRERRAKRQASAVALMRPEWKDVGSALQLIYKPVIDRFNDVLYFDTMMGGLQELLRYADRNYMAFSREARLPFLAHDLVAFVFSLPTHLKCRQGYTKWILRAALASQLPASIVWRKGKTGFEPPQKMWMEDTAVQQKIQEARVKLVDHGVFQPALVSRKIRPADAYDAVNTDWRSWMVSYLF